MRLLFILLMCLLCSASSFGQNSFSLNTTMGLNFNFTTPALLEVDMVKSNALIVQVTPKNSNISVYVKISYYKTPSGFDNEMSLRMDQTSASSTSGVSNLVTGAFDLSLSDQRLFSIAKKNQAYSIYYNLICTAPGYEAPTGNYNFTLMFTMTSP